MSRILIITHTHDDFLNREYLLRSLMSHWTGAGHQVSVVEGTDHWPEADIAILHVDLTVIPEAYCLAAQRYPVLINASTTDLRKSRYSRHLVRPGDSWRGPVIVKTELNCGGVPELRAAQLQQRHEGQIDSEDAINTFTVIEGTYPIFRSIDEVPDKLWQNPGIVAERFLPEQDQDEGYWMRAWVFLGDRERCSRLRATKPVIRGNSIIAREPAPVPDELRAVRERLGFDYGKFDFVVHDGKTILFDVNRTPHAPPAVPGIDIANAELARGLDSFLKER